MDDLFIIKDALSKGRLAECMWLKNTGIVDMDIAYPELDKRVDTCWVLLALEARFHEVSTGSGEVQGVRSSRLSGNIEQAWSRLAGK